MDFPIPPEFWWSTDFLLIINPSSGMDQEIHYSGQGRIDSVKINPSLLRMRECTQISNPNRKKIFQPLLERLRASGVFTWNSWEMWGSAGRQLLLTDGRPIQPHSEIYLEPNSSNHPCKQNRHEQTNIAFQGAKFTVQQTCYNLMKAKPHLPSTLSGCWRK